MPIYEPRIRGVTYMTDRNIMQVSGQQILNIWLRLWVQLICECDLYAKIQGIRDRVDYMFCEMVEIGLLIPQDTMAVFKETEVGVFDIFICTYMYVFWW